MKTAVFLGAGASKAEGAPVQNELFRQYFSSENVNKLADIYRELARFFNLIFRIDLADPLDTITFPTFEEALGVLDLSESRRESFKGFNFAGVYPIGDQNQNNVNQVELIRRDLILIMAKAISDGLKKKEAEAKAKGEPLQQPHTMLVQRLTQEQLLTETIFLSTNYDLLIDQALEMNLDYGVEFAGTEKFGSHGTSGPVKLFKIHGSLNWLYCPVCNNLNGYESKVVLSLLYPDRPITLCTFCKSLMSPVIVPPTFYKDMSRVFLSDIWNKAENALRDVGHIIFCGYSLPDADMHVKYLLKRVQTNRTDPNTLRFTIVNHHENKDQKEAEDEYKRYLRFFGRNVHNSLKSFQDFARDPKRFYAGQYD